MIGLNIDLEIWPTPPLIFTQGVLIVQKLAFETLWFRKEATYRFNFFKFHKFNDGPLTSQNLV